MNDKQSPDPLIPADGAIPQEVVQLALEHQWSSIRAWREYLGISASEMAQRLGISEYFYSQIEAPETQHVRLTLVRVANALGILPEQL